MAVDKKSDYVGNHGGSYTDMEGQSRQFTYVDHDKKTTISASAPSKKEVSEAKIWLTQYREKIINDILSLPPSLLRASHNERFYIFRNIADDGFTWNESALRDPSVEIELLQSIKQFTSR